MLCNLQKVLENNFLRLIFYIVILKMGFAIQHIRRVYVPCWNAGFCAAIGIVWKECLTSRLATVVWYTGSQAQ